MAIKLVQLRKQGGFTLAEMAIVIVLIGIMMTMGLKMTTATLNSSAYSQTASKQTQIKTALIGYLRSNGTLPCPNKTKPPDGTNPATCNTAAQAYGAVPWGALGLPKDTAQDGWGNLFTYRVANGLAPIARNWTSKTTAATTFDISLVSTPTSGLTIMQGDGIIAPTPITTNAVVVILSAGKNGYGANTILGILNSPPPGINSDEVQNATPGTTTFVMRPYTEATGAKNGPFDDLVTYMLPQDLLQPLLSEQTIAACKSYCTASCTKPGFAGSVATPYCTGPNTPISAANASPCISSGNPYPTCTGAYKPALCKVTTTPIPIGNPFPSCSQ